MLRENFCMLLQLVDIETARYHACLWFEECSSDTVELEGRVSEKRPMQNEGQSPGN